VSFSVRFLSSFCISLLLTLLLYLVYNSIMNKQDQSEIKGDLRDVTLAFDP